MEVEAVEDRVHDLAADVLEVDVDAVRGGGLELRAPVLGTVVDGRVEAELLGEDRALLGPAGDADDAGAVALGELPGDRADRAGGGRDDDGLTLLGLADFLHPDPGREPGHAERAEVEAGGDPLDLRHPLQRRGVGGDEVLGPAGQPLDQLPLLVVGVLGLDHPTEPERAHRLADLHRRQVARHVLDPGPVGRIERDPLGADQRLAVADPRQLLLDELEGPVVDPPLGALAQREATVDWHGMSLASICRSRVV